MIDEEPPSRTHRPLFAVAILFALFIGAGFVVFETNAKHSDITPGRSLSVLVHLPASNAKTRFSIDAVVAGSSSYLVTGVQPQISIEPGTPLLVKGWAVDDRARAPGKGVRVVLDGGFSVMADYGMPRADVAETLQNSNLVDSGFEARVPTKGLAAGQHELTFEIIDAAGKGVYRVPQRIQFTVRQS
jgi:hypothetical protein